MKDCNPFIAEGEDYLEQENLLELTHVFDKF